VGSVCVSKDVCRNVPCSPANVCRCWCTNHCRVMCMLVCGVCLCACVHALARCVGQLAEALQRLRALHVTVIPWHQLALGRRLGAGGYGEVFQGSWQVPWGVSRVCFRSPEE